MIRLDSNEGSREVKAAGSPEIIAADACIAITGLMRSMWDVDEQTGEIFEMFLLSGLPIAIRAARQEAHNDKGKEVK